MNRILKVILSRHVWSVSLLGFASGLPYAFVASTLQAWYTKAGAALMVIGILSLVRIPYTWKFLWAPLMDRFVPPLLGRRRGWLFLTQTGLILFIAGLTLFSPKFHPYVIFSLSVVIALLSASQDISINAYMVDIATEEERGMIAAVNVVGWRIGAIVSSAIALIMAQNIGWKPTILIMAACMLIGLSSTLFFCQEPKTDINITMEHNFYRDVIHPFLEFFIRKGAFIGISIIIVIILYKMGDAFALSLNSVFILRHLGFSLVDLGTIGKFAALVISILGGLVGGALMARMRLLTALIIFGLLQAGSNLTYMYLAHVGHNFTWLVISTCTEYFTSALGTTAFVALIMTLCHKKYSATQYALFSALAFFSTTYLGPVAAVLVDHVGWEMFYFWSFVVSLPGIILLIPIRKHLVSPNGTGSRGQAAG